MTNPYQPPAAKSREETRPSTGCLRFCMAALFGFVGLSMVSEGTHQLALGAPLFGVAMLGCGLFVVFTGWYAFLHGRPR